MAHPTPASLPDVPAERLLSSFAEVQAALSCSRSTVYKLVREGELTPVKIGGRRYVVTQSMRDYVDRLVKAAVGGRVQVVGAAQK